MPATTVSRQYPYPQVTAAPVQPAAAPRRRMRRSSNRLRPRPCALRPLRRITMPRRAISHRRPSAGARSAGLRRTELCSCAARAPAAGIRAAAAVLARSRRSTDVRGFDLGELSSFAQPAFGTRPSPRSAGGLDQGGYQQDAPIGHERPKSATAKAIPAHDQAANSVSRRPPAANSSRATPRRGQDYEVENRAAQPPPDDDRRRAGRRHRARRRLGLWLQAALRRRPARARRRS